MNTGASRLLREYPKECREAMTTYEDNHRSYNRQVAETQKKSLDAARSAWHKFMRGYLDTLTPEEADITCHALRCYLTDHKK